MPGLGYVSKHNRSQTYRPQQNLTQGGYSSHPVTQAAAAAGAAATAATTARAAASPSVLTPSFGGVTWAGARRPPIFPAQYGLTSQIRNAREARLSDLLTTRRAERLIGRTRLGQNPPFPSITVAGDNLGGTGRKGYSVMAYVPRLGANKIVLGPQVAAGLRPGYQPNQASRAYSRGAVLHEFAHTRQRPDLTQPLAEGGADLWAMGAARRQGINYTAGNINNGYGQFRRTVRALPGTRAYTRFGQFGLMP